VLLKIGSASKDISITIAVEKDHRIIETNFIHLNNEIVPAKGIIRIYKLIAPKNVLRKRPWSSPDYQLL
jgi:hypothetical protein